MKGYTNFTKVHAEEFTGALAGAASSAGALSGKAVSTHNETFSVDTTLTGVDALVVTATASAASKSLVLGVEDGQVLFVVNVGGTNSFTLKGITGDSGTSLAAGKVALVIGSTTANTTKIYVLN